jgi:hypothetical protein
MTVLATNSRALATYVASPAQLDSVIQQILSLQMAECEDETANTLTVVYTNEAVKDAPTIPMLKAKGFQIVWQQQE